MMNRIAKYITGILLDFGVILICYFAMRLIGILYNTFFHTNFDTPYTFAFVWVAMLFLIPYWILKKRGTNSQKFFNFAVGVIFIGGISAMLTKAAYSIFFNSYKWEIIESNYVGISGEDEVPYENMYEEGTRTESIHGFVFAKNDSRIKNEHEKTQEEHEDVSTNGFIFWQSALADGFDPKYVSEYKCCDKPSDRIELYFTVGPLRIVEAFFDALLDTLLFLVIPIIMRLFGKHLFFSDTHSFIQFIKYDLFK